jgi:hypothetical protein
MAKAQEPMPDRFRRYMRRQREEQEEFIRLDRVVNLDGVNKLAKLSDAELIATNPALVTHEMEMQRRLKEAITALTVETITARRSADRTGDGSCGSRP